RPRVAEGRDRPPGGGHTVDRAVRDAPAPLEPVVDLGRGRAGLQGLPATVRALPGGRRPAVRGADGQARRRLVAAVHLVGPRQVPRAGRVPRDGPRRSYRRADAARSAGLPGGVAARCDLVDGDARTPGSSVDARPPGSSGDAGTPGSPGDRRTPGSPGDAR